MCMYVYTASYIATSRSYVVTGPKEMLKGYSTGVCALCKCLSENLCKYNYTDNDF